LDCPDWVLAEMNIMSKIVRTRRTAAAPIPRCTRLMRAPPACVYSCEGVQTSVRMKLLVVQVLNELLGGTIDVRLAARAHRHAV